MQEKKFDLRTEPWIAVRRGNKTQDVSLAEVFRSAHETDALAGEVPTQDVAILRMLLAVMYAVFTHYDVHGKEAKLCDGEAAMARWRSLWDMGHFPEGVIDAYLEEPERAERFWLFHPKTPFFQVAGLKTNEGAFNPVTQIIADVPSREERRFLTNVNGEMAKSLTYAEATRWLVHLQAWDYAGKKASVVGGTKDGGGTGWCGKLGIVYASGRNLFETLLLNFVLVDYESEHCIPYMPPEWDMPPKTAAKKEVTPKSHMELLTLQSRRALLTAENDRVTGVISSYGDVFEKENMVMEQMSGWHVSSVKNQGYIPNMHSSSRSLWRDLGALLSYNQEETKDKGKKNKRAGVLDWVSECAVSEKVNVRAVGYEYGAMQGVVTAMIADSITLNTRLLGELDSNMIDRIVGLLSDTDEAVHALWVFSQDLERAAGSKGQRSNNTVKEQAYFELDEPFRAWLIKFDPEADINQQMGSWRQTARQIISNQGDQIAADASDIAFAGRELKSRDDGKGGYIINTSKAQMKFFSKVKKCLGGGEGNG